MALHLHLLFEAVAVTDCGLHRMQGPRVAARLPTEDDLPRCSGTEQDEQVGCEGDAMRISLMIPFGPFRVFMITFVSDTLDYCAVV